MYRSCFLIFLLVCTGPVSAEGNNWTGWLGPKRDGRVKNFVAPKTWPQKLTNVWSVDVGTGYGTPLVVDGSIFQHARQGNQEVLWCLDLKTGDVRWRKAWDIPFKMGGGGERHGNCLLYTSPSPRDS